MKRIIILLISCLLVNYSINSNPVLNGGKPGASDSIRVLSSPDLYNLSMKWAKEYNKLFPEPKINVISMKDGQIDENLLEKGGLGFVSNQYCSGI